VPRSIRLELLDAGGGRQRVNFPLGMRPRVLRWNGRDAQLDGEAVDTVRVSAGAAGLLQGLDFAMPPSADPQRYPMLRGRDVLRREILEAPASMDQSP